jgi:hypothetical protein
MKRGGPIQLGSILPIVLKRSQSELIGLNRASEKFSRATGETGEHREEKDAERNR